MAGGMMKATHGLLCALALVGALALTPLVSARGAYLRQALPQLHVAEVVTFQKAGCTLCHVKTTGGNPWNPFGESVKANFFGAANKNIAEALYLTMLANKDSDGDGYGDALEIIAHTLPGDAASKPTDRVDTLAAEYKAWGGAKYFRVKPAAK
jgi:hypothetical protein